MIKFVKFMGINPVFQAKDGIGRDVHYLFRLDWALVLVAMAAFAVWMG